MSKIRVLKATSFYQDFLDKEYFVCLYNEGLDYASNHRSLMDTCFGWSDFWKIHLEATGEFEMEETVINAEQLQKKWAKERNLEISEANWKQEVFTEQVKAFAPDVLFMQDIYHNSHFLHHIRKLVPSIKLIIGWDGILYHNKEVFKDCDIVMSCVDLSCNYYKQNGFKTYFYRFGFETGILDRLEKGNKKHPVSFVGSLVMGEGYHLNRFRMIANIARKTDIELWVASFNYQWRYLSKHQIRRLMDFKFEFVRNIHAVGKRNHGPVFGLPMYQVLFDSLITFNSHGDHNPVRAGNMRLYEATGSGACLLTDWKENLNEFFVPDQEVVTYKNDGEAIEKILYLLDHDEERKKIAMAGQKRTLENYSIRQTMVGVAELIKANL
jgi:spore maturation protein CgeB